MPIFTAVAAHAAGDTGGSNSGQDFFELSAPATTQFKLREVRIGQFSDAGDAAAELLSVRIIRFRGAQGDTGTMGSGGTSATPRNIHGHSGAPSASVTVRKNNTVLAQDTGAPVAATADTLIADAFNVQAGWWYYPPEEEMILVEANDRLVVRLSAAADALSMNGTVVFEEIGKRPS